MNNAVAGFSKLSKEEKINWIAKEYFSTQANQIIEELLILKKFKNYTMNSSKIQLPTSIFRLASLLIPKWKIARFLWQESSVVAAASKSAKFWSTRGGFKATVINTEKNRSSTLHVHR
jgi:hydroxymethylglutaryl-CoA reductase